MLKTLIIRAIRVKSLKVDPPISYIFGKCKDTFLNCNGEVMGGEHKALPPLEIFFLLQKREFLDPPHAKSYCSPPPH